MTEISIKENNLHEQLHHVTPLLISLCVIQTHSAVVLTYSDQTVDTFSHSTAQTRLAKLTFTIWSPGLMYLSVTLGNRRYALHLSTSYGFDMLSHLAVSVSRLPFIAISHSTLTTSWSRTRLQVHLR
jgi:hypothetical protein